MWKILCLLVIAQGLKASSQAVQEAGEKNTTTDSLPCLDQQGLSHNHGDIWQEDKCEICECQNGTLISNITKCGGIPHESCFEKPTSEDQCCPKYQCDSLPCLDHQGLSHNHGDIWQEDKCEICECQNGTMISNITKCGGIPHESCFEKPTSEDQCCPKYQCDSLPCLDEEGSSRNDGETWQPDKCKHCKCDNGIQSCNTTICGGKPHESCLEKPTSEDKCCPEYQCDSLPCRESNGDSHDDGDNWQVGKCTNCTCHNGTLMCQSEICVQPDANCVAIPGTDDGCCPEYKCASMSCISENGSVHEHGSKWQVDKCKNCECYDGEVVCIAIICPVPHGKYIAVPSTEECCPTYRFSGCVKDGKHYAHGERTSDDPCTWCTCVNSQLFCTVWFCPYAGNLQEKHPLIENDSHSLCRRVTPPGSCCPGKKIVCEQPISACHSDAPAVQTDCNDHMCLDAVCENHPNATCTISRCGQCHVIFIDDEGEEVDCGHSQNE